MLSSTPRQHASPQLGLRTEGRSARGARRLGSLSALTLTFAATTTLAGTAAQAVVTPQSPVFTRFTAATGSSSLRGYAVDLNGDGNQDLLTGRSTAGFSVELGNGNGTFQALTLVANNGNDSQAPGVGDINNDGKQDVLISTNAPSGVNSMIRWGIGNGTFSALQSVAGTATATQVHGIPLLSDLDRDGKLDLVLPLLNAARVYRGDGAGGFSFIVELAKTSGATYVPTAKDLNGDLYPDLVLAGYSSGSINVFLSDGVGGFLPNLRLLNNGGMDLEVVDLDGDSDLDIVQGGTGLHAFLNASGTGSFTRVLLASGTVFSGTAAGDFNADGAVDIAAGFFDHNTGQRRQEFYLNDGAAAFVRSTNSYVVAVSDTQNSGDFNNDGYPDVFFAATNGRSTVFTNVPIPTAPVVTTQPGDQTAALGATATLTARARGYLPPTVQWQRSTDGGGTFANIAGATSTTLAFTANAADDNTAYQAVFTNATGTATSDTAFLDVLLPPVVVSNPVAATAADGNPVTFSATDDGNGTFVEWQVSGDNGGSFVNVAGANAFSYTISEAALSQDQHLYRAVFSNADGSVTTATARLTVVAAPSLPQNLSVAQTGPRQFTVMWDAPASAGASTITGYTIGIGMGMFGSSYEFAATARSAVFDNMELRSYDVGVRASTSLGFGARADKAIALVEVIVPAPASAPAAVPTATATPVSATTPATTPALLVYGAPRIGLRARTIQHGEESVLSGTTRPLALVNVYGYTRPSTTYVKLGAVRASADGVYSFTSKVVANSRFYVVVPRLGRSAIVAQNVRSVISMTASRTSADTYVFSGRVSPVHAGQRVTVFYRTAAGGKAMLVRTQVDRFGRYRVSRTVYARGHRSYAVFGHVDSGVVMLGNNSVDRAISTYRAR